MSINFSLLRGIDLANGENLIFLAIIFAVFIILATIFFVILSKIIKIIKNIIVRLLNIGTNKVSSKQKTDKEQPQSVVKDGGDAESIRVAVAAPKNLNIAKQSFSPKPPVVLPDNFSTSSALEPKAPSISSKDVDINKGIEVPLPMRRGANEPQPAEKDTDFSVFKDRSEVSRMKLEHEMKKDADIWKASKAAGLKMSPVERAELVKEVFSQAYGRNISKTDLKQSLKKLNQKMVSSKSSGEHEKLRKEIKFFKKIGGIKN